MKKQNTKDMKHTQGTWKVGGKSTKGIHINVHITENHSVCNAVIIPTNDNSEEAEANAKLIADAGTTANECGLLPSELLAQRTELLEVLKRVAWLEPSKVETHEILIEIYEDLKQEAEQAIKKATE